jgi:hypothetical protein
MNLRCINPDQRILRCDGECPLQKTHGRLTLANHRVVESEPSQEYPVAGCEFKMFHF